MNPFFRFVPLIIFTLCVVRSYSQPIPEKTLLWRIEGKGIVQPSYIYGTMHLYDQRLFNFGDSVYRALEFSKGFANEIDPAVFIDSIFAELKEDQSAKLKDMVDEIKYKDIAKKLKDKLGIEADELTNKKIASKRIAWYYNQRSKDDMDAAVDFYLYDVAKKQGKLTGGIEDYSEQKDLFDEVGNAIDIEEFANEKPLTWKNNLNRLIDIYLQQDIEKIYQISSDNKDANHSKKILDDRNIKMTSSIDSFVNIRSTFFAVGAAHLAGNKGLINLLRQKGYRIFPVFSSQKLHAKKYTFKPVAQPWQTVTSDDDSYTVEMPGKASNLKISDDVAAFKMHADFGSTIFYMTTAMPAVMLERDNKQTLNKAVERFIEGAKHQATASKHFTYKGNPAVEVTSYKDDVFFKINIVLKDSRLYLLMVGAQKKNTLDLPETTKFFQSLNINSSFKQVSTSWLKFKETQFAFELDFPGEPVLKKPEQDEETEKIWNVSTYSSPDIQTGAYYSMILMETVAGFLITNDSAVLKSRLEIFSSKDFNLLKKEYFNWDSYPALKFQAKVKENNIDFLINVVTVNRINRNFTALAVVPDNEQGAIDASKFVNSFQLLNFNELPWQKHTLSGDIATVWAPPSLISEKQDSEEDPEDGRIDYMIDNNSSISYSIYSNGFGQYFSRPNEDSLLREIGATFYSDTTLDSQAAPTDSLIYIKKIANGTKNGLELLVKQTAVHQFKKIRIFIHGDSAYKLMVLAPLKSLEEENSKRFFEDFRFSQPQVNSRLFINHNKELLVELNSMDSVKRQQARQALEETSFSKEELPLLHTAMAAPYLYDTLNFFTIHSMLAEHILDLKDPATLHFIEKEYSKVAINKDERALIMLKILSQFNTKESYGLLKRLWLNAPPLAGRPHLLSYVICDSLELTTSLFPDLQEIYSDTITGNVLVDAASNLLDSNRISKENVLTNLQGIYSQAKFQLSNCYTGSLYYYKNNSLFKLLAAINTKESLALLNEFTLQPDLEISMDATETLLDMKEVLSNDVYDKLAADPNYRIRLYDVLKKTKNEKLFPKKYNNQVAFAESQLTELAAEDDVYLNKSELLFTHRAGKNAAEIYFSFKIKDEDGEQYLGFIGPYSKNQLKQEYTHLRFQVLYDVPFSKTSVNDHFKAFFTKME